MEYQHSSLNKMSSIKEKILSCHKIKEMILNDKRRPEYHFCVPFDLGFPADPNAPFYYEGKYHLMYIYESREDSYRWGHVVSTDLVHWESLPDALLPDENDGGIYSGGVILEGEYAYVAYWALGKKDNKDCIRIARSKAPNFIEWEKINDPLIINNELGIAIVSDKLNKIEIGSSDPSNIWKKNGKYYLQLGNLCLLDKYRDNLTDTHKEKGGDHAFLFVSDDLIKWNYLHEFYERDKTNKLTTINDDCMCPYFGALPYGYDHLYLTDKYIELFLSHNQGVQYYIGNYDKDNDKFIIETFGKMSFIDNALFAPEALLTHDGRLISFYWLRDNQDDDLCRESEKGWSGIHALPRELFLTEDNKLGIAPLRELKNLRINKSINSKYKRLFTNTDFNTDVCEIVIAGISNKNKGKNGIKISFNKTDYLNIYIDFEQRKLIYDLTNSNSLGRKVCDSADIILTNDMFLDIFIDKCVIEVFFNNEIAISRQVFERTPNQRKIEILGNDDCNIEIYEIMKTN